MINSHRACPVLNPWAVVVPALLIALLTIGTNTFTDQSRESRSGSAAAPQRSRRR